MSSEQLALSVSVSVCSQAGVSKQENQDAVGHMIPVGSLKMTKGAAFAVADGISSSRVGAEAAQSAVHSFLSDYMDTPESWSAKTSGLRVLKAVNAWLVTQNLGGARSFNQDKGMVCAFAGLVIKSRTVHVFHSGDVRVLRVRGEELTQLTKDHRSVAEGGKVYLSGGLGLSDTPHVEFSEFEVHAGDWYVILSDGVHEWLSSEDILQVLGQASEAQYDFEQIAQVLCTHAVQAGSQDDCSAVVLEVLELPEANLRELTEFAPSLRPLHEIKKGQVIDGLKVLRPLAQTPRSHVYVVEDEAGCLWVLKTPSVEKRSDEQHLERMLMEEWVARRLESPHLLKAPVLGRARSALYTLSEYVEGQSLSQWMHEHPKPSFMQVRQLLKQIGLGLQAMHRREVVHRDLRPENVLIDERGTVTLIDFGAVRVMGLSEFPEAEGIPGSVQYAAPEYFLGSFGTARSDIFSMGVLAYQMLSGQLPFGLSVVKAHSQAQQLRLKVRPLSELGVQVPDWAEYAIYKALCVRPEERYAEVSEFMYELEHPSPDFVRKNKAPLLERDPVRFWQILSAVLALLLALDLVWPFWG